MEKCLKCKKEFKSVFGEKKCSKCFEPFNIQIGGSIDIDLNSIQLAEHKTWVTMCNKLQSVLEGYARRGMPVSNDFFNEDKNIRELAILIEKWGYESARLRVKLNDWEKRGVHW